MSWLKGTADIIQNITTTLLKANFALGENKVRDVHLATPCCCHTSKRLKGSTAELD
jgi:hypothetical protein